MLFRSDAIVDILQSCNFCDPYYDLEKLIDKCLIVVTKHDTISMHDLMQQMGMEIVQQESEEPKKHRRLLYYEDAPEVLAGDMVLVFFYLLFPFFSMHM